MTASDLRLQSWISKTFLTGQLTDGSYVDIFMFKLFMTKNLLNKQSQKFCSLHISPRPLSPLVNLLIKTKSPVTPEESGSLYNKKYIIYMSMFMFIVHNQATSLNVYYNFQAYISQPRCVLVKNKSFRGITRSVLLHK